MSNWSIRHHACRSFVLHAGSHVPLSACNAVMSVAAKCPKLLRDISVVPRKARSTVELDSSMEESVGRRLAGVN